MKSSVDTTSKTKNSESPTQKEASGENPRLDTKSIDEKAKVEEDVVFSEQSKKEEYEGTTGGKIYSFPELGSIYETDAGLVIKVNEAENVTNYSTTIKRSDEKQIIKIENHEHLFPMNVYGWKPGEEISVCLFAEDQKGDKRAVCENFQYVIGGEKVISRLCATQNFRQPFTSVDLNWHSPKCEPESYKITVYKPEQCFVKKKYFKERNNVSIDNLTPSTWYYFEVVAVYADNELGKAVKSLEIKTGDDPNAQQVEILKDANQRKFRIRWKKSTSDDISYYIVYLKSAEKSEKIGEQKVDKTKNEVCFQKLKSNTDYVAHVTTMGINNKSIADSVSSPVSSNKIYRDESYKIEIKGKPIVTKYGAHTKNGNLECFLNWSMPDLGDESTNFEYIRVEAFMKKIGGKIDEKPLEVQENTSAKPFDIKFGKTYQFEITCIYKDLDSSNLKKATETITYLSEMRPPSGLDVKFLTEDIKVSWKPSEDAAVHNLTILSDKMERIKDEIVCNKSSAKFPMSESLRFGKTCTFVITAIGENKKRVSSEKEVTIGGDLAVTDVVAKVSLKRKITVGWQPPIKGTNKYRVRMYEEKVKGKCAEQIVTAQRPDQCLHTFSGLKANTLYYFKIFPEIDGKFKDGSQSDSIKTSEVRRDPKFNIKSAGKPKIKECKCILDKGKYESIFKWELADIGEEAQNYLFEIKALVTMGSKKADQMELVNSTEAKPISLKFGERYEFTVISSYKDKDDHTTCDLKDTYVLDTDIGSPVISNINWEGSNVVIDWQPAEGAAEHFLSVLDDATKIKDLDEKKIGDHKLINLKMSNICKYGKTCNFIILATGGNKKSNKDEKKVLIGGDTTCTDVIAKKDANCPGRAVLLSWKPPKKQPNGYKVQILEITDGAEKQPKSVTLGTTITFFKFEELKTSTTYICRVSTLYSGQSIDGASSDQLQTDKRSTSGIEKAENFGKPKNICHEIVREKKGGFDMKISWDAVDVGENFKLEKYHIDVYEPGFFAIWSNYHLNRDYEAQNTTTDAIFLKTGKTFEVDLVTTYKDLDSLARKTPKKKYSFSTKPSTPKLKNCICEGQTVTLSWEPVNGAKKYNVVVKDLNSKEIENKVLEDLTCEAKFKVSNDICVGKTYNFTVTADLNGVCSEATIKNYLIGGNYAVTDVVLAKDEAFPRRAVIVKWNSPVNISEDYQVEIYQRVKNDWNAIRKTTAHNREFKFSELKTSTTYMCKVSPIYGEVVKEESISNQIQTDKKVISEIETSEDYGKPEKISDDAENHNRKASAVQLSWSTVNAGTSFI